MPGIEALRVCAALRIARIVDAIVSATIVAQRQVVEFGIRP